jgi:hypothetical protein
VAGIKLRVIPFAAEASATPLHDGINGNPYPYYAAGVTIQTNGGDVHLGGSTVTGQSDGFTIPDGSNINLESFKSRGTSWDWDLREIYFVGGPFKLILETRK